MLLNVWWLVDFLQLCPSFEDKCSCPLADENGLIFVVEHKSRCVVHVMQIMLEIQALKEIIKIIMRVFQKNIANANQIDIHQILISTCQNDKMALYTTM